MPVSCRLLAIKEFKLATVEPVTTDTPNEKPNQARWLAGWRNIWKEWPIALGHFLLTCLFTFPLIFRFTDSLPGMLLEDRDQNIWNLWWVQYSLLHLHNPFHTDFIYYPTGVSLYFHTLNFMNALISLPIQLLFGTTLAYNFVVFFSFVMGGVGAYLLLRYLCGNRTAAFVGSLVFDYSPYHMGTLKGLMQLISLEWLPFYILFLVMATREKNHKIRNSVWAAIFLFFTGLTDWYYTLFLLMFTAVYCVWLFSVPLWQWLRQRQNPLNSFRANFLTLLGIMGLFALLISPILIPMLRELSTTTYYLPTNDAATDFSANLAAFFVPNTTSTLFGQWAANFPAQYVTGYLAAQVYLGYVALVLGLLGLIFRKQARFGGIVLLIFWLLSLGPQLQINGDGPNWPMPFAFIQNLPIIKVSRSPDRFMVIGMLALAVCVTFGVSWLSEKTQPLFKQKKVQSNVAVASLAGLLIGLEFLQIPFPVNTIQYSQFWQQLGQDNSDYSIVELPPQGGFWSGGPRMAYQTIHHKRIFDGYISREFDHPFYRSTPGFEELAALSDVLEVWQPEAVPYLPGQYNWYDAFSYYHVKYIVIDYPQTQKEKDTFDLSKNRAAVYRVVGANAKPIYQDNFLEAYAVPQIPDPQPFLAIGDGWYAPEKDAAGNGVHRWAKGNATLQALWAGSTPRQTTLNLKMGLLSTPKKLTITLNNQTIYSTTLNGPPQEISVPLTLASGSNIIQFQVDGQSQTPQSLNIGNDTRQLLYYIDSVALK